MKNFRLLFMIAGFGALALTAGFADDQSGSSSPTAPAEKHAAKSEDRPTGDGQTAPSRSDRESADSKHADDKKAGSHSSAKTVSAGKARPTIAPRANPRPPQPASAGSAPPADKPAVNARAKAEPPGADGFPLPGQNKPIAAAKTGPTLSPAENVHHTPLAGLSAPPPPKQVIPHTGPAPAVIGGAATSTTRTTAALSGTGIKRKP
jgi:hypothetical protein